MATTRGVGVYNFSEKLNDTVVFFSVLKLKQSFLLWIGTEATMEGLAVAMRVPSVSYTSFLFLAMLVC